MSLLDKLAAEGRDQKARGLPAQQFDRAPARITIARAQEKRDTGMARAEQHAGEEWADRALEAVRRCCQANAEFHSDRIYDYGLPDTDNLRALGPVMRRAAKLGYCHRTDRTAPSNRSNRAPKPVWASHLWVGEKAA